jgi:hypothetical protein
MKSFLFFTFFISLISFSQSDWREINPPANVLSYNATNHKYHVDSLGIIYCIYTYYNGTNEMLQVDKYDALNKNWSNIHFEPLTYVPSDLHVDKDLNDVFYFTFVSNESGAVPELNLYAIENGFVSLKIRNNFTAFQAYSKYDFKADQMDKYYWFFKNVNGIDASLGVWNSGSGNLDDLPVPQFSNLYLENMQLNIVGDSLWFVSGDSEFNKLQLVKTHKNGLLFMTHDNSPEGYVFNSGIHLYADQTISNSNKIDKLSIISKDFNNNQVELTLTNSIITNANQSGDFWPYPNDVSKSSESNKAFYFTNFNTDQFGNNKHLKVIEKDYTTDTWDTIGSLSTEIFKINDFNVQNFNVASNEISSKLVASYDSMSFVVNHVNVFNAIPNVDSVIFNLENTLCPNTNLMNLTTEFSIWDKNADALKITNISSSNQSVVNDFDINYFSSSQNGKRQNFVVRVINTNSGTTTLTFVVTDGYDTITFNRDVTFAPYLINSITENFNCGDGQVTLSATTSNNFGTIFWYDDPITSTFLTAGDSFLTPIISTTTTYYAEANDNTCVSPRVSLIASIHPIPTVNAGADLSICEGNFALLFGSGTPGLSYSWDNGISDNISFIPVASNSYTVTGTDVNGCFSTDVINLNLVSLPIVSAGPDITVCENGAVTLMGFGAINYSWNNGVSDGVEFYPNTTLEYIVIGTDMNACTNSDTIQITVNPLPSVNAGGDISICEGSDFVLLGSGALSYVWDNGVIDGVTFNPLTTQVYNVIGTDFNGCSNTDQVEIGVMQNPIISAVLTNPTVCAGNDGFITVNTIGIGDVYWAGASSGSLLDVNLPVNILNLTAGAYNISFISDNTCVSNTLNETLSDPNMTIPTISASSSTTFCEGNSITLTSSEPNGNNWSTGETSQSIVVSQSGTYFTDVNIMGCSATSASEIVTVNPLPLVNAGADVTVCSNDAITLTGTGAFSYTWDNGVIDGVPFNPVSTLSYVVIGEDINECTNSDTVQIFVNLLPSVDAGPDLTICLNDEVTLSGSGALSYSWDNGILDGTPFTPNSTNTYVVTGTDINACSKTDTIQIIVNSLPNINAGSDLTICSSDEITLIGSGGLSYVWDNGVIDNIPFNPSVTSTYVVIGTDLNACTNSDTVLVTVNSVPTISAIQNYEICENETLNLNATSSSPFISWFNQAIGGTEINLGGNFLTSIIPNSTVIFVQAFENGCASTRLPIVITIHPNPIINLSATSTNCGNNDGSASAVITGGTTPFTYYWSNGNQEDLTINNLSSGSYYFNVEDVNGCKALDIIEILPSNITISPTITNPLCYGDNSGSISIDVQGFTGNVSYLWNTGNTSSSISNLIAGTYDVIITSETGCIATSGFDITQPDKIEAQFDITNPTCGNNNGSIQTVNVSGGVLPYNYLWSNGSTNLNLNNVESNFYTLIITDGNDCTLNSSNYLSNLNAPYVNGVVTNSACNMSNGAIDLTISPNDSDLISSITWSNSATTEDINNLNLGEYVSFVTSQNGCMAVNGWNILPQRPQAQEICIVSVDSVTTTNLVVWEKAQTTDISHYNIYRESNQINDYQLIDFVEYDTLSVFNDVIASPQARSWRYKISAVDVCGVESLLSAHHKTVHLTTTDLGILGTTISWDSYEGNLTFSSYKLWRHSNENNWENIATLPITATNYSDEILYTTEGLDYMLEVIIDETCTATVWRTENFNVSRSNKDKGIFNPGEGTGNSNNNLIEFQNDNIFVNVSPNPFENEITIALEGSKSMELSISDLTGKIILEKTCSEGNNVINLNEINKGIYFVNATISNKIKTIKIIKQ